MYSRQQQITLFFLSFFLSNTCSPWFSHCTNETLHLTSIEVGTPPQCSQFLFGSYLFFKLKLEIKQRLLEVSFRLLFCYFGHRTNRTSFTDTAALRSLAATAAAAAATTTTQQQQQQPPPRPLKSAISKKPAGKQVAVGRAGSGPVRLRHRAYHQVRTQNAQYTYY